MIGTLRAISLVALSIVWASALSRPSVGQTPTLRSIVRRVGVDIVVTDAKGNAVTGLTQEDFSVEEDRVPQPVRTGKVQQAWVGKLSDQGEKEVQALLM